ncbi:broad-complex core protein isoforms 1/2/3/4/5 isoform X2 [Chrysoperla carnea]|uniref:broad-complex core protein isoforms 1/2/3/4/5 isoform X2 n=1 Tax=Chrysoperla carnea TaxID=189513 RepID=UPI001D05E2D3|nr:broad-complex core protein isoforms 1/2/3/4/5 isoform X2 [Chrysoperla carnea]
MDDEQQFCLKWNNHQSTLVSVFDSLLRRNQLLDCTLAAEGRSLKAHKVILSACSPYFESLLADYYDKHPVFILKDVKFKELEAMMDYMYRGEVNVSQDQLGPLLKAAESLQIKGLSDNRRESRSNNEDRKREPPILPPRDRTPPPAPSLPQVKGLVIEQKKVDIMNMNNREGSQSPGRRKKRRRQSIDADAGNDSSIENHDGASNGSSSVSVSQPIVPPNVPLNDSRSELSAASSVKTKTEENMPQVPLKQKLEPHSELMLEPKSEYIEEDMNDDSIEDLTLDDDELDMDHNRPGPSHGGQGDGSNQGFGWQMDPSQDETFMAAQEAVGQHRDAQELPVAMVKMSDYLVNNYNSQNKESTSTEERNSAEDPKSSNDSKSAKISTAACGDPILIEEDDTSSDASDSSVLSDRVAMSKMYQCSMCPKKFLTKHKLLEHTGYDHTNIYNHKKTSSSVNNLSYKFLVSDSSSSNDSKKRKISHNNRETKNPNSKNTANGKKKLGPDSNKKSLDRVKGGQKSRDSNQATIRRIKKQTHGNFRKTL